MNQQINERGREGKEASSLWAWERRALSEGTAGPGVSKKEERLQRAAPRGHLTWIQGKPGTGLLDVGEAGRSGKKLAWVMGWGTPPSSAQEIQLEAVWPLHSLMRIWFLDWVYQWVQKKVFPYMKNITLPFPSMGPQLAKSKKAAQSPWTSINSAL